MTVEPLQYGRLKLTQKFGTDQQSAISTQHSAHAPILLYIAFDLFVTNL